MFSFRKLVIILRQPCNLRTQYRTLPICYDADKYLNIQRNNSSQSSQFTLRGYDVEIKKPSWPSELRCSYMWLRDHCRCDECYNFSTSQRKLDILSIAANVHPSSCSVDGDNLRISWSDGHSSTYSVDWLWSNSYQGYAQQAGHGTQPILWDKCQAEQMPVARVSVEPFMSSHVGLQEAIESVLKYGVVFITSVLPTREATAAVAMRLAEVQRTLFGDTWEFSDRMVHGDTAYSQQSLDAHTDGMYLRESPGLMVLHCLQHDGAGGQTLLVDGFRAVAELRRRHPDAYDTLRTTFLEAEYLEEGKHYATIDTVLRCDPVSGSLQQVRFNLYDRAPLRTVPVEGVRRVYESLQALARAVREPSGEWWFKLEPGTVLFVDNWRVLHGRASFTGTRRMAGCYLSRAHFLNTAKQLRLV